MNASLSIWGPTPMIYYGFPWTSHISIAHLRRNRKYISNGITWLSYIYIYHWNTYLAKARRWRSPPDRSEVQLSTAEFKGPRYNLLSSSNPTSGPSFFQLPPVRGRVDRSAGVVISVIGYCFGKSEPSRINFLSLSRFCKAEPFQNNSFESIGKA
jgi:hypothetical protein